MPVPAADPEALVAKPQPKRLLRFLVGSKVAPPSEKQLQTPEPSANFFVKYSFVWVSSLIRVCDLLLLLCFFIFK